MYLPLQADDLLHADLCAHKLVVDVRDGDGVFVEVAEIERVLGDEGLAI